MKLVRIPMERHVLQCLLIVTLLSILASLSTAAPDSLDVRSLADPAAFIQKAGELSKNTSSIASDFVQKKHLSVFSEDIVSKGKFFYKRENRLRWEYTTPMKYVMVFHGGTITVQDGEKKSVFDVHANPLFAEINDIMLSCFNGTILKDIQRFRVSYFETRSTYIVSLLPISEHLKGAMQRIELVFRKQNLMMTHLRIMELSGDYSDIVFRNTKLNATIPDETFTVQ